MEVWHENTVKCAEDWTPSGAITGYPATTPPNLPNYTEPWISCNQNENTTDNFPICIKILISLCLTLIIMMTCVGNSLVCFVVHQKPSMRSAINLLLANMALSNIMLAMIVMPFAFATTVADAWTMGEVMCATVGFLHAVFVFEATSMLVVISLDRYARIVRRREDNLTARGSRYIIGGTWLICSCFNSPPLLGWGSYKCHVGWMTSILDSQSIPAHQIYIIFHTTMLFFLPMLLLVFNYSAIVRSIRQNSRKIHSHPDDLTCQPDVRQTVSVISHRPSTELNYKMKSFKTIFIVFLMFVLCWIPASVALLTWNLRGQLEDHGTTGSLLILLGYLQSALNPVIYCTRISKLREALKQMLLTPKFINRRNQLQSKRQRINPSAMYEQKSTTIQELHVQPYIESQMSSSI